MYIVVEGLDIPNTNEWWPSDEWSFYDLRRDIVKILTNKTGSDEDYNILVDNYVVNYSDNVVDTLNTGDVVVITRNK